MHIVTLWDTEGEGDYLNCTCQTNDELATILLHLQPRYKVVNIQTIENVMETKDVLVKDNNLEHGGN